ncbi:hypothetical protein RDI58_015210 [Solanum bulbocastanum]|uniref:Uncharacterized protein n=1 Tax=Solanum bulbocastanum TaxID=147425 RepID=A0AAN8YB95_SOLBU
MQSQNTFGVKRRTPNFPQYCSALIKPAGLLVWLFSTAVDIKKHILKVFFSSRRYHCNFKGRVEKSKVTCQKFEKEIPLVQDIGRVASNREACGHCAFPSFGNPCCVWLCWPEISF